MKRYGIAILIFAVCLIATEPRAFAVGFGFYGLGGSGSADWSDDYLPKFSADTEHRAFGISLDTGLSGRHLFNYHLNIGRETFTNKNFIARDGINSTTSSLDMDGIVMSHTFGFGGALSQSVRLWVGPEIRWHWVKGSPDASPNFDVKGGGFGFGPSLGVNFNFSSGLTLMVRAGYIMQTYSLDGSGYVTGSSLSSSNSYDVDERFTYLSLEFLFRTPGDR